MMKLQHHHNSIINCYHDLVLWSHGKQYNKVFTLQWLRQKKQKQNTLVLHYNGLLTGKQTLNVDTLYSEGHLVHQTVNIFSQKWPENYWQYLLRSYANHASMCMQAHIPSMTTVAMHKDRTAFITRQLSNYIT